MSRYATFATGIYNEDLRAFFPFQITADEGPNSYPDIHLSLEEAQEFAYRMKSVRVQVNLQYTGAPDEVIDEVQPVGATPFYTDERQLVTDAFFGISNGTLTQGLAIGAYRPSTQTFQMAFLYVGAGGVTTEPLEDYLPTAATLTIFGHNTVLYEPGPPALTTGVTGSIVISAIPSAEFRQYRDAAGANPIWNSVTGGQILFPVPADLG